MEPHPLFHSSGGAEPEHWKKSLWFSDADPPSPASDCQTLRALRSHTSSPEAFLEAVAVRSGPSTGFLRLWPCHFASEGVPG